MELFSNKNLLSSGSNQNYFRSFDKITAQRSNKALHQKAIPVQFVINIVRSFYLWYFFFRAVLQIVLFGAWTFYQMARPAVVDEGQKPVAPRSVVTWLLVLVANILLSTSQVWSLRTEVSIRNSELLNWEFTTEKYKTGNFKTSNITVIRI